MKMFKQFFKDMPSECLCFGIVGFIALAGLVCSVVFNVDVFRWLLLRLPMLLFGFSLL